MTLYLGVDVAKRTLVAATRREENETSLGTFANDESGFEQLVKAVSKQLEADEQVHLILEPTSSYHLGLVGHAFGCGWLVSLPSPQRVREWANGMGRRAKTDTIDARTLASFGQQAQPSPQQPLSSEIEELTGLLRRKEDLEQMVAQERNRQESISHRPTTPGAVDQSLTQVLHALEQALRDIEAAIDALLQAHPHLARQRRHLCTVPGIGQRNVLHVLILLYRWDAYTAGQGTAKGLTAYVGLDPVTYQSGSSVHRRSATSKMGNAVMRRRLYMSALGATNARFSPLTVFYTRLLSHNKPKKVALVACARKILVWALAVFRANSPFQLELAMPHFPS